MKNPRSNFATPDPMAAGNSSGNVTSEGKPVQPDSSFPGKAMKHAIQRKTRLFPTVQELFVHAEIRGEGDRFGIGIVHMRMEQTR